MREYWIRVKVDGQQHEYLLMAASWFDAFEITIKKWGIPRIMCIKPIKCVS